jgi:hypothetical protein
MVPSQYLSIQSDFMRETWDLSTNDAENRIATNKGLDSPIFNTTLYSQS